MNHLDDEDGGGEDWLVSYADLMTLIACFFILMMAFANYDPVGFNVKAEQLSKHFRKDKNKSSTMKFSEITEEVAKHELEDRSKVSVKDGELVIKFSSSVMFDNGKTELKPEVLQTLDALIDIIKVTNLNYRILVEGHSDDDLSGGSFDSQWAVSSARAARVAERFEYFGFPSDRIVPIGRGDGSPLVDSKAKDGSKDPVKAKMNRRVVIRLLEPREKKKVKFGLGVYFKDATEEVNEATLNDTHEDEFEIE